MKSKLLIIFGVIFIALFVVYNVGLDIGNVHLGKKKDDIEKDSKFDIQSSQFSKDILSSKELVVLNLWATWCQPCLQEMPVFLQTQKEYPDVRFATLSIDNDEFKLKNYLAKHPEMPDVTLANASYRKAIRKLLENRKANDLASTETVPVTYFIKGGKVLKKIEGSFDGAELVSHIKELK